MGAQAAPVRSPDSRPGTRRRRRRRGGGVRVAATAPIRRPWGSGYAARVAGPLAVQLVEAVGPRSGTRVAILLDGGDLLSGLVRARGAAAFAWDGSAPLTACDAVVSLLSLGFTDTPRVLDGIRNAIGVTGVAAHVIFSASLPPLLEGVVDVALRRHGFSSRWLQSLMCEAVVSHARDRGYAITTVHDVGRFDSAAEVWRMVAEEGPLAAELAGLPGDLIDSARAEVMAALAPSTRADGTLLVPITARLLLARPAIV